MRINIINCLSTGCEQSGRFIFKSSNHARSPKCGTRMCATSAQLQLVFASGIKLGISNANSSSNSDWTGSSIVVVVVVIVVVVVV